MTDTTSPAVGLRRFDSDGEVLEHGDAATVDVRRKAATCQNRSDLCSAGSSETMSQSERPAQKPAGTADVQTAIEAMFESVTVLHDIGLDDCGRSHHYNPDTHQVVVGDDDYRNGGDLTAEERIDIPDGSDGVWDYYEFIAEETDLTMVEKDAPTEPPEGER